MILNKKSFPYIQNGTIEYRDTTKLFDISNYSDRDYWLIEVLDDVNFSHLVPEDILEKVKNDDVTFLLISATNEPFVFHIDHIYNDLISGLNVPENKIVVVSENRDIHLEIDSVAERYNKAKIQVYLSSVFECGIKTQIKITYPQISKVQTLAKKHYDKKFLNFNRRWRIHRPLVVALLESLGLTDSGYVSLAAITDDGLTWQSVFSNLVNIVQDDTELLNLLISNQEKILSLPNMYLDTVTLNENKARLVEKEVDFSLTKKLYEDTYFSLVSETCFFDRCSVFLSEKTFKPIAFKHPFILISGAGSLSYLKDMGYKTFHPYINEDYDNEPNSLKRIKMILEETSRLSKFTDDEVSNFIDAVKPITEYNFMNLIQKHNYSHLVKIG